MRIDNNYIILVTDGVMAVDFSKTEGIPFKYLLDKAIANYYQMTLKDPCIIASRSTFDKIIADVNTEWINIMDKKGGVLAYYCGHDVKYDDSVPENVVYLERTAD